MNIGAIIALALSLVKPVVLGIESVYGDVQAGKSKRQDALDAITAATGIANVADPADAAITSTVSSIVTGIVGTAIDNTVTATKATGEYQAATSKGKNLQQQITAKNAQAQQKLPAAAGTTAAAPAAAPAATPAPAAPAAS